MREDKHFQKYMVCLCVNISIFSDNEQNCDYEYLIGKFYYLESKPGRWFGFGRMHSKIDSILPLTINAMLTVSEISISIL
jgi:hypothetical protein